MEPEDVCIREPDLVIETDASRQGWGASCMGVATGVRLACVAGLLNIGLQQSQGKLVFRGRERTQKSYWLKS
jgi:hypothetical protein